MDTIVQDSTAAVGGVDWSAFWVAALITVAAVAFVAVAIFFKKKADQRQEDYLEANPETDPHAPKAGKRSRDKYGTDPTWPRE